MLDHVKMFGDMFSVLSQMECTFLSMEHTIDIIDESKMFSRAVIVLKRGFLNFIIISFSSPV